MTSTPTPLVRWALVASFAAMPAVSATAQSSDGSFSNPARLVPRDGQAIYRTSCQACHMPGGEGAAGAGAYPALAKNVKLQAPRYPISVVLNGSKAMPPFANWLDDEQTAAVISFIRTAFGNNYVAPVSAADVKSARK